MPEMIPVGNTGIQPDPLGSISKMMALRSSQLGIQQQQQNLQTGAYQQQSAQAEAQGAQRVQAEQQAAQKLVINGTQSGKYTNPDGTLNRQQLSDDIIKVAPTSGQQIAGSLLSQANEIVSNKQALFNLTSDKRAKIGDTLGSLAGDPTVDHTKLIDALEGLRQQYPEDKEMSRMLQSVGGAVAPNAYGPQLQQTLNNMASATKGTPSVQPGTNAAAQNINRGTFSGQNSLPSGNAPNPTSPEVSGAAARQSGTAGSDIDRANKVSDLQQQSAAAIPLTKRIDQLADDINSGKVAKMISETGNYFGVSSINEARSQLNKDLGQVKGLAIQNAGSDSRAGTILEGYPTDTTPAQTTHAAMDYIRGTARQNLARGQLLQKYQGSDPQGLRGFQAADSMLTGTSNPLMHEFMSLPADQRAGFYKRNFSSPQEAQAFKDSVTALQKHTNGIVGQ